MISVTSCRASHTNWIKTKDGNHRKKNGRIPVGSGSNLISCFLTTMMRKAAEKHKAIINNFKQIFYRQECFGRFRWNGVWAEVVPPVLEVGLVPAETGLLRSVELPGNLVDPAILGNLPEQAMSNLKPAIMCGQNLWYPYIDIICRMYLNTLRVYVRTTVE